MLSHCEIWCELIRRTGAKLEIFDRIEKALAASQGAWSAPCPWRPTHLHVWICFMHSKLPLLELRPPLKQSQLIPPSVLLRLGTYSLIGEKGYVILCAERDSTSVPNSNAYHWSFTISVFRAFWFTSWVPPKTSHALLPQTTNLQT
jgi:hypothetical protein